MADKRWGNVIRNVGHDQIRFLPHDGNGVDLKHVTADDLSIGKLGCHIFEDGHQFLVDLNGHHLAGFLCQGTGQAAQPGADLQNMIWAFNPCHLYDPLQYIGIDQKILTQALVRVQVVLP